MSQVFIQQYLNALRDLKKVSGTSRESVVREAFKDLLKAFGRTHDLVFIPEYEIKTAEKETRYVDGALLYALRLPFGYWEAKDEKDDIDAEIQTKFRRGYPQDNIIFEDSVQAVLIQNKREVMRSRTDDVDELRKLLNQFFSYERSEISEFRKAVEQFKKDIPSVLDALRAMISASHQSSTSFKKAATSFLDHAKETINPRVSQEDVREMLIQHILTEEIFAAVFPGTSFHQENNVAKALYRLEHTFFTGKTKFETLKGLEPYYAAIRGAAARIGTHHEKQTFLKVVYENFYKVYNPKAADRLGVIYTPNEVVRFMVESADWLCHKHFTKSLIDRDVHILDPATGTGTFITSILEHFRGQSTKLRYKYKQELHANEVAILPYYVANLNIEATYAEIISEYEEFQNLCFVDTLDNVGLHTSSTGTTADMFGGMTAENVARINRQNAARISVIIGNPPYNANQLNENENNKNREYPSIDSRIKDTYIAESAARKTKLYDMYARFLRWASDRLNDNGIIAFVSNSSFIDSRTFDGFRACVAREFNEAWVINLKGNARTSGEQRRRECGNVFDDQIRVGIAVYFLVRKKGVKGFKLYYQAVPDYMKSEAKREFLVATPLAARHLEQLEPDDKYNWINVTENDFASLTPLVSQETKAAKTAVKERAIFKHFGNGVNTARDQWVTNLSVASLAKRVRFFLEKFDSIHKSDKAYDSSIKWSRNLKTKLARDQRETFDHEFIRPYAYRPFSRVLAYLSPLLIDELGQLAAFDSPDNTTINFPNGREFRVLAATLPTDFHFIGDTRVVGLYRYDDTGTRVSNVTNWALARFKENYRGVEKRGQVSPISIFAYCYGVLHDPIYKEKYAIDLSRQNPRIPFYKDFSRWASWGQSLLDLHTSYEKAVPASLKRTDQTDEGAKRARTEPTALLRADKNSGTIMIDSETTLSGVPPEAWEYRLGTKSAIEWVLGEYKDARPTDPTILAKFDDYKFSEHKEAAIQLLSKVVTVSLQTVKIVSEMSAADGVR